MTDIVSPSVRSRMMSGIRGKDTKPELLVRRWLHAKGYRFRLHVRDLSGCPDIVLPKWNAVVFVHGCFWHRHEGCRYATTPATRREFWQTKLDGNMVRDRENLGTLIASGWRVAIVWECSLKADRLEQSMTELCDWLRGDEARMETQASENR